MVAIAADDRLKPGREKATRLRLQSRRATGTDEQIRKDTGQPQHPDLEVTRGEINRTTLLQSPHGHPNEPENGVLRLVLRQKTIDQLDQMRCANCPIVVLKQLHRRIQQLRGLDSHEIPIFLFEKLQPGMREGFERRAEPVFHFARAVGDASQLSMITAEKCDDSIGLSERVRLQYNRVALMESHTVYRIAGGCGVMPAPEFS